MKKILILVLVMVVTGACLPAPAPANPAPQVDVQATIDIIVQTAAAQTLAAQPSPIVAPPTETGTPVVASSSTPTIDITETPSSSPVPNLTTTPVTATSGPGDNPSITPTSTLGSGVGALTLTPTLGPLTYGTLPPAVAFSQVSLVNKSKTQVYISLQLCDTEAAGAILEYPVKGTVKIKAPVGTYLYVVWVGGRQLTGTLQVPSNTDLTIRIYRDKVEILQ